MYPYYRPVRDMNVEENVHVSSQQVHAENSPPPIIEQPHETEPEVIEMLLEALKDEATDIEVMNQLMPLAASPEDKEVIRQIKMDEQKHYKMFQEIYYQVTGERTEVEAEPVMVNQNMLYNYEQNIFASLNAADFYRKIYFAFLKTEFRDMLFEIITDEQAHGTKFTYLYAKTK